MSRLDSAEIGNGDIQHNNIGIQRLGLCDGLAAGSQISLAHSSLSEDLRERTLLPDGSVKKYQFSGIRPASEARYKKMG
jgi:hypothetical protein